MYSSTAIAMLNHTAAGESPYLIAAVTGRSLAASASRGGHRAVVLDCFGDRDTRGLAAACHAIGCEGAIRFDGRALLAAASAAAPPRGSAGLVYGGGFEARTTLLARLARGRTLYGNPPEIVEAVKDPRRFFPLLDRLRGRHPAVRFRRPNRAAGWLVKETGGAGGAHVRPADQRQPPAGAYFQRFEEGQSLSALFLADGRRARVLGFSRQWTAPARRARPFLYGGAAGGAHLPPGMESDVCAVLERLVNATGLVGLNGLDFLQRGSEWLALEVNPRPTATVDLYDPDYPCGLFDWHLRACRGELPERAARPRAARAHGIVYLSGPARMSDELRFPGWCRDVPMPGTRLRPGDPVCTVHAAAPGPHRAIALVRRRQAAMQQALLGRAA
jgi:predicted ATP-grasp superfamily ATP-dependent carboligase